MGEIVYKLECYNGYEKTAPTHSIDDIQDILEHIMSCDFPHELRKEEVDEE